MKVVYDTNNSGGSWWLNDEDWKALEAAGWDVHWYTSDKYRSSWVDDEGRWLGGLARGASIETPDLESAIQNWESVTGQFSDAVGCECCGQPHYFYVESE